MTIDLTVDAVLFDMDGTLVDSNALVDIIWNEFSAARGLDSDEVRAFAHGRPSRSTVARYVEGDHDVEHWMEQIHTWEAERFDIVTEIPGAAHLTNALPLERWAVVTSALRAPAAERLASVGIPVPTVLIGADDVADGKPDPEGYRGAAERLGFDPAQCVVFEDTDAGVQAALAAGCQVVVVGSGTADSMAGLPRVRDMTEVTARVDANRIVLTLADDERA